MSLLQLLHNEYVVGFLSGLASGGIIASIPALYFTISLRRLLRANECLWLEVIDEHTSISYSLGEFSFSLRERGYVFSGRHYASDGKVLTHWKSVRIYYDHSHSNMFYIYEVHRTSEPNVRTHGYGFIDLERSDGALIAKNGYFIDAATDNVPRLGVKYFPAHVVAKRFYLDLDGDDAKENFIKLLSEKSFGASVDEGHSTTQPNIQNK
jgi:hypothetical protein